jgi:hypothetical protein
MSVFYVVQVENVSDVDNAIVLENEKSIKDLALSLKLKRYKFSAAFSSVYSP